MASIGIVNPGGVGDILMSTSVLKYKNDLWPEKDIIWYSDERYFSLLSKIKNIKQVKKIESANHMYVWYQDQNESVYVPCPWLKWAGNTFPPGTLMVDKPKLFFEKQIPARILGPLHPCLDISPEDEAAADTIMGCIPKTKTIMLETGYLSQQSFLSQDIFDKMVKQIRAIWKDCNFLCVSRDTAVMYRGEKMFSCSRLSLSTILALFNRSDAFIGVSSGISCAVCSWAAKPTPKLELISLLEASTRRVSRGPISTVLNESELFEKLPSFLAGKYDFCPTLESDGLPVVFERKKFSQNGEDGIIESLFHWLGTKNKTFVELVNGTDTENNTRKLAEEGWKGKWISPFPMKNIPPGVEKIDSLVTQENINGLLEGLPEDTDLLSVDLDGNDYWIWKAIEKISPRVVVIEYNPFFPPPISKTINYYPDFKWTPFSDYFGASLCALDKLARQKGYSLVCCDSTGVNAFFVRNSPARMSPEEAYRPFTGYAPIRLSFPWKNI